MSEMVKGRASYHKILLQTIMTSQNKGKSSGGAGNHRVVGNVSGLAARGRGAAGSGPSGESEVLLDDRKKLGMDTADPQNRSEWRGRLRRRLVKQVQPSVEDNGL